MKDNAIECDYEAIHVNILCTFSASPFTLKSSLKYSTEVVLNSEEESLAEYMEGLPSSSGDSFEKYRRQVGLILPFFFPSHM